MTLKGVGRKKKQCIGIRFLPQQFYCFLTCSKLAKSLTMMTCSKLAVLNKAIQGTFFKSQKSKNRLKSYLLWKAVANRAIHGTFLSLKKVKKRIYGNYSSIFACDLEKYPGSLYLPLLPSHCTFLRHSITSKHLIETIELHEKTDIVLILMTFCIIYNSSLSFSN